MGVFNGLKHGVAFYWGCKCDRFDTFIHYIDVSQIKHYSEKTIGGSMNMNG